MPFTRSRSSAELVLDAYRQAILSQEAKAARDLQVSPLQVAVSMCKCISAPQLPREVYSALGRGASFVNAARHTLEDVVAGVRDGAFKSGVYFCGRSACDALGQLPAMLDGPTRLVVVDVNLTDSSEMPPLPSHPQLLHITLRLGGTTAALGHNVTLRWPEHSPILDADLLAAMRTLVVPIAQEFKPSVVVLSTTFSPRLSVAAYARVVRALLVPARGRLVIRAATALGSRFDDLCSAACVGGLHGADLPPLPRASVCADADTVSLLRGAAERLAPTWPCLGTTLGVLGLTEHQFQAAHDGDDTVAASAALACLSMSTFREEDEDDLFGDNSRKRALSESVTGGAAALLKVRNSCSSPSMLDP